MKGIAEFFEKIRNTRLKDVHIRMVIQEAVKKRLGIEVGIEQISISGATIVLNKIDPAARSVIFIKKAALLGDINSQQGGRVFKDVR